MPSGKRGVTLPGHVLRERIEQVSEQLDRKFMFPNDFRNLAQKRFGRRGELAPILGELSQPYVGRVFTFVGEIVRAPGETVDDSDRLAQPRRHEQRSDREVLVMAHPHGSL